MFSGFRGRTSTTTRLSSFGETGKPEFYDMKTNIDESRKKRPLNGRFCFPER